MRAPRYVADDGANDDGEADLVKYSDEEPLLHRSADAPVVCLALNEVDGGVKDCARDQTARSLEVVIQRAQGKPRPSFAPDSAAMRLRTCFGTFCKF